MGDGKFLNWLGNNKDMLGQFAGNVIGSIGSGQKPAASEDVTLIEKGKKTDTKQNYMIYIIGGAVLLMFMFMRKK
jgi:hypothetical protein